MRLLLDTSVLIAAMVETHPSHAIALPWVQQVKQGQAKGYVALHTLAELYSTLTRLPLRPPISGPLAQHLIDENVVQAFEIVALTAQDYLAVIGHLAQSGLIGAVTYDALILHVAKKVEVDQIITLNQRDFGRIYPTLSDKIVSH
ncbi:PIN domain-containing protein [Anaerolineales bacterium HSG25]|nr:PIN domain-containing protein [Anaerolineales bacterium HSG25]